MSVLLLRNAGFALMAIQIGLVALAVAMPLWLVFGTSYRVSGSTLTVTMAFRRERIPLAEITDIRPSSQRSIWAWQPGVDDFALGTQVVEIDWRGRLVLVSPVRQGDFLVAIDTRNSVG